MGEGREIIRQPKDRFNEAAAGARASRRRRRPGSDSGLRIFCRRVQI